MSDNRRRVLDLLAEGKITAEEAERLLAALERPAAEGAAAAKAGPAPKSGHRYLRVVVEPGAETGPDERTPHVNLRVPMALIRAGVRFTSLIPAAAAEKINAQMRQQGLDVDLKSIRPEHLEELVEAMRDLEVNVDGTTEKVRIYFE